jgi:hypothetical protein
VASELCQSCGVEVVEAEGDCPDCGRPLVPGFIRPSLGEGEEVVEYECDALDAEERVETTDSLTQAAIPYRWEPGFVLAVTAGREAEADALFGEEDELFGEDDGAGDGGEGEQAFAAVGDLYDAADRLFHSPVSAGAKKELRRANEIVRTAEAPYGFNPVLWRTAGELATQLLSLFDEGASDDDVRAGAEALRDVLQEHV